MGPERAFPARWGEVWSKRALKARDLKLVRTVATAAGIKGCHDACTVLAQPYAVCHQASESLPSTSEETEAQREEATCPKSHSEARQR